MATAKFQLRLKPTADALNAAIQRSGLSKTEIAKALDVSTASVFIWTGAKGSVRAPQASKLGKLLDVDPASITSPKPKPNGGGRPGAGRPKGSRTRTPNAGPAARAVALLEARQPVLTAQPVPAAQGASRRPHGGPSDKQAGVGVFGMEVREDGVMAVWVRTEYPLEKGAEFVRWLLAFGVTPGDAP